MESEIFSPVKNKIDQLDPDSLPKERKALLGEIIQYLEEKKKSGQEINLNFICTHNSRRSQFAQLWAKTLTYHFDLPVNTFSGGIEVTAVHQNAIETLRKDGFVVQFEKAGNPKVRVKLSENAPGLTMFSKMYDHPENPKSGFAAVMVCSSADEACPFIPGAKKRISLEYEDPGKFDGTPKEEEKYQEINTRIATEMFYVFSKIGM